MDNRRGASALPGFGYILFGQNFLYCSPYDTHWLKRNFAPIESDADGWIFAVRDLFVISICMGSSIVMVTYPCIEFSHRACYDGRVSLVLLHKCKRTLIYSLMEF